MTKLITAALLAAAASVAHAQTIATAAAEEPTPHALDGRIGLLVGGSDVGNTQGGSVGLSTALGYRHGDVTVRGLFDYYKVGDSQGELRGRAARAGAALRYSLANNAPDSHFAASFWGELGAGWEHVTWLRGGVLDRPSAEGAFGLDLGGRSDLDPHGRRREVGTFMDFRAIVGEAPEVPGAMATCAGPCTQATTPTRTDLTMFFELGVYFGR
jgi:hypothetical protein